MEAVSPRQKSAYSLPSMSRSVDPCAVSTTNGNGIDQSRIQCMGTPS
jgi:hypothetical protein